MVKSFPTKTQQDGRFFGSQLPRLRALRKGRIAGQSSTVGYQLLRCVSILQMKRTLLAPWPFQILRPQRFPENAVNNDVLRQNLNRLPEDKSGGSERGTTVR